MSESNRNSSENSDSRFKFIKWKILNGLLAILLTIIRITIVCGRHFVQFLCNFYAEVSAIELMFVKMSNIYSFICQLFFLTLCDVAIVRTAETPIRNEERIVSGLTTLLFYSVFGYFITRIRDIYLKDWNRPRRRHELYRDYMRWIFKIVIEWAKAIAVVICLREQGMKYRPDLYYNIITFSYYMCTEKIFLELIETGVTKLNIQALDSLENLYVPIFLYIYTILSASFVTIYLLPTQHAKYAILSSYFTLYLRIKDLILNYICPFILEKQTYASFRTATNKDIEIWDDICAVCLNKMNKARITPCNHLFHPQCLKRCLKDSFQCPLCKQNFLR